MSGSLGGGKPPPELVLFAGGGKVGKADVELGAFHVHVDADQALILRQGKACLDGIVKEIAQNDAEVQLRHAQFDRDVGVRLHRDLPRLCQGDLAVQDGVRHGIAGLDDGVHRVQVGVQLVQISLDAGQVAVCGQGLHDLDVIAVVVPPAADLTVHVLHFLVVGVDELPLVGGQFPVDASGEKSHFIHPLLMMARLMRS